MSTANTAARGAAWTILASLLSRGLGLVATLIMIRFISPEDYGEVSAATVVVFTVNYVTTLGVGIYVIANRSATREDMFHATVIHVALGVVALLALWVLRKPLSPLFDTPNMYRYVPGIAASAFIDRLAFMPERVLVRGLRFRRISLVKAMAEVAFVVAALGTAWRGWGGMSIVVANVVRSGLRGAVFVTSVSWKEWLQFAAVRWAVVKKIASYGFTVTMWSVAGWASSRWDNLLVSRFFGPAVMATYNLAYNLADIPAVHIGEQIADVMGASFAHMAPDERRRTLLRSFGVIGLVTFPLALGIGVIAPSLGDLFLNAKWAGAAPMLLLLSALSLSRPIYGTLASFLVVEAGPRIVAITEWITVAVLMGSISTFGRISPLWTCGAVGFTFALRSLGLMYVAQKSSGIRFTRFLRELARPLLATLPMIAAAAGIRFVLLHAGVHFPGVILVSQILAAIPVYVGAVFIIAPVPANEVLSLVRRRRDKRHGLAGEPSGG
jgi:lipopolysaccharide exporter